MVNWKVLPRITSVGSIPAMGDCYYDGVISAHNSAYYILMCDEINPEIMLSWQEDSTNYDSLCEGRVYLVYKLPSEFNENMEEMETRTYVQESGSPIGYILERDWREYEVKQEITRINPGFGRTNPYFLYLQQM